MSSSETPELKCGCKGPVTRSMEDWCITPIKRCAAHNSSRILGVYECGCYIQIVTRQMCYIRGFQGELIVRCAYHQQEFDAHVCDYRIEFIPQCKYTQDADGNPVLCDVHRRDESLAAEIIENKK